jgi:hypothetical protein
MRKGLSLVYSCGEGVPLFLGSRKDGAPVLFEVKVEVFAHGSRPVRGCFKGATSWPKMGEFQLKPIDWPTEPDPEAEGRKPTEVVES